MTGFFMKMQHWGGLRKHWLQVGYKNSTPTWCYFNVFKITLNKYFHAEARQHKSVESQKCFCLELMKKPLRQQQTRLFSCLQKFFWRRARVCGSSITVQFQNEKRGKKAREKEEQICKHFSKSVCCSDHDAFHVFAQVCRIIYSTFTTNLHVLRGHSFSTYAKFSEKPTFLHSDTYMYVRVSGSKKC